MNNIKHASRGVFYSATNHTFTMHGRDLLGPIRMREIPSIDAWELIDDTSIEDIDHLEAWKPMPISSVMPSFEQCSMTLARKTDTTFVFRLLLTFQSEKKKRSNEQRKNDIVTALKDALELVGSKYMIVDMKKIVYTGAITSLPRKFRSNVLSQLKYMRPGIMIHSIGLRVFVPSSALQNDPDSENMTLQEFSKKILKKIVCQKGMNAFEEFVNATILSCQAPDVEKATFQSGKASEINCKFSDKGSLVQTHLIGSFVYCANPQHEPDEQARDADIQTSPFIIGRVEQHCRGVYKLKIFHRFDTTEGENGEYVETEDYATVQEMALKPVPNFVSDFQGKWHCTDEMNPLVFALSELSCNPDKTILEKTTVQSDKNNEENAHRFAVGPSVIQNHMASHISGSASFRVM